MHGQTPRDEREVDQRESTRSLGAHRTSIATLSIPLVATLLGVWLLHERLGIENASGLGLILIGLWLTMRRPGQDNAGERRHRIEVFEA